MSIFDQYQTEFEFDVELDGRRYVGRVDATYDVVPGDDDERGRPRPRFEFFPLGPVTVEWIDDDDGPGELSDADPLAIALLALIDVQDVRDDIAQAHRFPEEEGADG